MKVARENAWASHDWLYFVLLLDVNPLLSKTHLEILLCLTTDDFTRQRETPWGLKGLKTISLNTLLSKTHLEILLCLTPDDFTPQRETP